MALRLLIFLCLLICGFPVFAQVNTLPATRITSAPKIDGNLDDAAWTDAPVAKDFIQNIPEYGKPATVKTEVRIVYDNSAIYVGAYLFDDPALIRKQLTARDEELRADVDY